MEHRKKKREQIKPISQVKLNCKINNYMFIDINHRILVDVTSESCTGQEDTRSRVLVSSNSGRWVAVKDNQWVATVSNQLADTKIHFFSFPTCSFRAQDALQAPQSGHERQTHLQSARDQASTHSGRTWCGCSNRYTPSFASFDTATPADYFTSVNPSFTLSRQDQMHFTTRQFEYYETIFKISSSFLVYRLSQVSHLFHLNYMVQVLVHTKKVSPRPCCITC